MHKKPILFAVCFFCLVVFVSSPSFGWINTGHKVVALVAWDDLTPKTKAAITDLLKQHPRYQQDLLLDAPADETPDEQARTAFATAATWPDMVRNQNNPMHTIYSHPAWHYIDIPFTTGGVQASEKPPEGPGPHNIVEALTQCTAELKDPAKSASEKAIDLCWVEHLIGDIHQPLHAASLFSPQFPTGDQGGNAEVILKDPPYPDSSEKLHLLWDSLPGDFASEELDRFEAQGLRADRHYSRESMKDLLTTTGFMDWANESHKLAVEDAYLDGKLETGAAPKGRARTAAGNPTPGAPAGYVEKAEHVAMHQVTIAGYRLADELNGIFDPK
jgi:S1/P1 Nuclease